MSGIAALCCHSDSPHHSFVIPFVCHSDPSVCHSDRREESAFLRYRGPSRCGDWVSPSPPIFSCKIFDLFELGVRVCFSVCKILKRWDLQVKYGGIRSYPCLRLRACGWRAFGWSARNQSALSGFLSKGCLSQEVRLVLWKTVENGSCLPLFGPWDKIEIRKVLAGGYHGTIYLCLSR